MSTVVQFPSPTNHFAEIWAFGYRSLIPVIPPAVPLSASSNLSRRLAAGVDPRGKAPGVKYADGAWGGLASWQSYTATPDDLMRWQAMGASVGIRTGAIGDGTTLVLIDADTMDLTHAATIRDIATAHLGKLPIRIGRYPKAGYLMRVDGPFNYTLLVFNEGERVELLSDRKQFVAAGVHPGTLQPYRWPQGVPQIDDVPLVSLSAVSGFLDALAVALPKPERQKTVGDAHDVDQARLLGDPEHLTAAIAALPNTTELFGFRESWLEMGYAIKAAFGPDREAEALDVFQDWSARWVDPPDDAGNDPEYVATEWARMKPPFRVGADKIYRLSSEHSGGKWGVGELWFEEPVEAVEPLFPVEPAPAKPGLVFTSLQDAADSALDYAAKPLIKGLLDQNALSVLYGESNTGKTFVALDMSIHIAAGRPWAGMRVNSVPVVYVAAEGGAGARKRARALALAHSDLVGAAKGRFQFLLSSVDLLHPEADLQRLITGIKGLGGAGLVVIDTLARAMAGGEENGSVDMGALVKNFDAIRAATGAHLLAVHHSGKDRAKGARGHSSLRAATDTELEVADRQVSVTKQRDLDGSFRTGFDLTVVDLGLDSDGDLVTSCVVRLCEARAGVDMTPETADEVQVALQAAWDAGRPWALAAQARERWAVKRMMRDFQFTKADAENVLAVWMATGVVVEDTLSSKSHMAGLRLKGDFAQNKKEKSETDLFD